VGAKGMLILFVYRTVVLMYVCQQHVSAFRPGKQNATFLFSLLTQADSDSGTTHTHSLVLKVQ